MDEEDQRAAEIRRFTGMCDAGMNPAPAWPKHEENPMPSSTPKWTSGPWATSARGARDICEGADGTGELIATAYEMNKDRHTDNDEATGEHNAAVMAAAPDLYAALEALPLDSFDKDMDTIDAAEFVDNAGAFFTAMQKARAAMAKARGESDAR
jgi:hypothetical protein